MEYRREIDGLRSVAVIPVIFFHSGITVFSGGYVGVDIFFVISGYLITSIIVSERQAGKFTITNFYERRARRILPALFLVMLACIPFAWAWMSPSQLKDFSQSLTAVSVFSSNILFWKESGYFAPAAELKPLLHTWSLAVEEQYYIFFPLFILAAWRFGRNTLFFSLLFIGSASLLLSQWASTNHPGANFYLLPTRLWELLIGSLIALHLANRNTEKDGNTARPHITRQCLSGFGLALILYAIFAFNDATPFPGLYALVPTLGTALVILFASRGTLVAQLLSTKLPVGIGLVSYSAYLWHQPLLAFARIRSIEEPSQTLMILLAFMSLPMAYVSWRYVEKPFRDKSKYTRSKIFLLAATTSAAVIGVGLWGHINSGFPSRTIATGATYADTGLDNRIRVNHGLSETCTEDFTLSEECRTSNQPEILVWGDSYAMHLVQGILSSDNNAKVIQFTKRLCGPIIGLAPTNVHYAEKWSEECLAFNYSVAEWIEDNTSLRYAVLSTPFWQYLTGDWKVRTAEGVLKSDESVVYDYFSSTLEFLTSRGIQPVVFAPPPSLGRKKNIGACLVKASIFGDSLDRCDFALSRYKSKRADVIHFLEHIGESHHVIWFDDFLCDAEACRATLDNTFIYRDVGHFSHEGSALVGSKMNFNNLIRRPAKGS